MSVHHGTRTPAHEAAVVSKKYQVEKSTLPSFLTMPPHIMGQLTHDVRVSIYEPRLTTA